MVDTTSNVEHRPMTPQLAKINLYFQISSFGCVWKRKRTLTVAANLSVNTFFMTIGGMKGSVALWPKSLATALVEGAVPVFITTYCSSFVDTGPDELYLCAPWTPVGELQEHFSGNVPLLLRLVTQREIINPTICFFRLGVDLVTRKFDDPRRWFKGHPQLQLKVGFLHVVNLPENTEHCSKSDPGSCHDVGVTDEAKKLQWALQDHRNTSMVRSITENSSSESHGISPLAVVSEVTISEKIPSRCGHASTCSKADSWTASSENGSCLTSRSVAMTSVEPKSARGATTAQENPEPGSESAVAGEGVGVPIECNIVHPDTITPIEELPAPTAATPTDLFSAVTSGNIETIRNVIADIEDINMTTERGSHILFRAVLKAKNAEVVRLLLEARADVHAVDDCGNSVMHFWARASVALSRLLPIGKVLMEAGAAVNAQRNLDGLTPLHHVIAAHRKRRGSMCFRKAIFLLENGADPLIRMYGTGELPVDMLSASSQGESSQRLRQLLEFPERFFSRGRGTLA